MDGVLIDSEPLWEKTEKILMTRRGIIYKPTYRDKILGLNQKDSAILLKDEFSLKESVNEIIEERIQILLRIYEHELNLMYGVIKLLRELNNMELKIALASSSPMKVINYVLNKFSLNEYFNTVVSGECTENGKPAPDIYFEAASRLKEAPLNCIAIEDSVNGVLSSKNAGMYCIAIPDKRVNIEKYKIADLVLNDISEINMNHIFRITTN